MTLSEAVLQKLAEWQPASNQRQTLAVAADGSGWAAALTADRHDGLGCLVWEIALRRVRGAAAADTAALRAWADAAAARLTGLGDPLKVVEVDVQRHEALLRSEKPGQRGDAVVYYEVLLRGAHEATLRRFQGFHGPGKPRQQIAFPLTHETLAKVMADLAAGP